MGTCDIIEGHDGEPYCRIHNCWVMPDGCPCAAESEARARAIRAVVAAQWGVACILADLAAQNLEPRDSWDDGWGEALEAAQQHIEDDLPTAEQIVDGAA